KLVQVIPHIEPGIAEVRITVENRSGKAVSCSLSSTIIKKKQNKPASELEKTKLTIKKYGTEVIVFKQKIAYMRLWSPATPFLYLVETTLKRGNRKVDSLRTAFGMREFRIEGRHFYLNDKKIFLRGGNIAFHRFLSDADRGTLPWNPEWIKKLLIDIPKAHNFNFFRNHLGQMYNRWYDVADEQGMMLQNEWMFWTTTGTKEQITKEFTRWLQDNWNHPSIVMWDALNECSDDIVQKEIIPAMKELDPTRAWESVDVVEDHPYIYSLGPVLNDRKFGFTRSMEEVERSTRPAMLNEFNWWWIDKELNPSLLMKDVVERWLGPHWTQEQLVAHQSFLVTELVELFRRMRVDAIQPFVHLSNNAGPTAHWFLGHIKNLRPKPIFEALRNAFAPFGASIELWDRHFFPGEQRTVRVFVFNDEAATKSGTVRCGIVNAKGDWLFETKQHVSAKESDCSIVQFVNTMPLYPGEYRMRSELLQNGSVVAHSEKILHVFHHAEVSTSVKEKRFALLTSGDELKTFCDEKGIQSSNLLEINLEECDALIVEGGMVRDSDYQSRLGAITEFLDSGRTVVLLEPEFGIEGKDSFSLALGVKANVEKRIDADKGGYDSYVFVDDINHPIWKGISQEHLKMFNGGYGGEMVSQHDVSVDRDVTILARCGLKLAVAALIEVSVGKGRLIISRIQTRGRLMGEENPDALFARRADPVAQRYLINLLSYATS
ncbi:MAG: glycoside hydrolase family 2 TIM barrel-domain containing protein, partial [bacterium]